MLNSLKRKWKEGLVIQSCSTPCDPMDYSPPGSSVHGILQARMLECHFLLQGNLSDSGIKPKSPALQVNSLPSEPPGKPSLVFSLTHKRGRESCCNIPNILLTLRVHPIPWKIPSACVYSVYCQRPTFKVAAAPRSNLWDTEDGTQRDRCGGL